MILCAYILVSHIRSRLEMSADEWMLSFLSPSHLWDPCRTQVSALLARRQTLYWVRKHQECTAMEALGTTAGKALVPRWNAADSTDPGCSGHSTKYLTQGLPGHHVVMMVWMAFLIKVPKITSILYGSLPDLFLEQDIKMCPIWHHGRVHGHVQRFKVSFDTLMWRNQFWLNKLSETWIGESLTQWQNIH